MSNSILPDNPGSKTRSRRSRAGDQSTAAYNKQYAAENAGRLRAYRAARYAANKEKTRELDSRRHKEHRARHGDAINAKRRETLRTDLDQRARNIERAKVWYQKNKEAVAKKLRDSYRADPEKVKRRVAEYQNARPEQKKADARVRANRRRARLVDAGGPQYTRHDVTALMELQRGKCASCKICIRNKFHIDHKIPVAKGGANDKENIELLCPKCNYAKGSKLPHIFAQEQGRLL